MKLLTLLSATILLFSSCSETKKITTPNAPLFETKWSLKKIHENGVSTDVDTKAFIRFNQERNSAGGNGSCNSFGSTVAINGESVTFSQIFSTKMFCESVQKTENSFLQLLEKANRMTQTGSKLSLYDGTSLLLEFVAE